jgi:hypothetical protein
LKNIKRVDVSLNAESDLNDGEVFYESQKSGLGQYFWDCLVSDIESLLLYGGVHSQKYGCYKMASKRFPYSIYYQVNKEVVLVVAVLPMKRNPVILRRQLKR